jgi:5-methylcytosine-specific restriction enzyme subunit McrC
LEINNLYNQIIKYTSKLLLHNTENELLRNKLFEITWILDEVDDVHFTSMDCEKVVVSPLNDKMQTILNYCKMFLSGMTIKTDVNQLEIFAFLIPTEKLFEDFLFGFIRDEFSNEKRIENIISQGSGLENKFLAKSFKFNAKPKNAFGLKPDIYIQKETGSDDLILDSKYKVLYTKDQAEEFDRKETGVGIGDVYQMLAYTVKLDVKTCHLLYPPSMDSKDSLSGYYEIDNHNGFDVSTVYYHRLPTMLSNSDVDLKELISYQEDLLRNELKKIICD